MNIQISNNRSYSLNEICSNYSKWPQQHATIWIKLPILIGWKIKLKDSDYAQHNYIKTTKIKATIKSFRVIYSIKLPTRKRMTRWFSMMTTCIDKEGQVRSWNGGNNVWMLGGGESLVHEYLLRQQWFCTVFVRLKKETNFTESVQWKSWNRQNNDPLSKYREMTISSPVYKINDTHHTLAW